MKSLVFLTLALVTPLAAQLALVPQPVSLQAGKGAGFQLGPNTRISYSGNDSAGKAVVESGWKDSPVTEAGISFPIAAGQVVGTIELYVQTTNGSRAENRISQLTLTGASAPLVIPATVCGNLIHQISQPVHQISQ